MRSEMVDGITVVVGSLNPVKVRAAGGAARAMFGAADAVGVEVESGVSEQPFGDDETLAGARNRATAARLARPDGDLWVGIEGGVVERAGGLDAMAWVAVRDRGEHVFGESRTATFTLPVELAALVRAGVELGTATDRVLGGRNTKQGSGTVGPLTGGVIDRTGYYEHAAVLAMIRFLPDRNSNPTHLRNVTDV